MSGFILSLLLVSACTKSTASTVHYYITPSPNTTCPQPPCTTISQVAKNLQENYGNANRTVTVSLSFLPGNHTLDRELSITQTDNFSMTKAANVDETVFLQCTSISARFTITYTRLASIQGLNFIGCGNNRVTQVKQFVAKDTIFQGVDLGDRGGTAIILFQVGSATIRKNSFIFNCGKKIETPIEHEIVRKSELLQHHYDQEDTSLSAGGAIFAAFSDILIDTTTFTENTARIGGALFAHDSSLQVTGSTFTYNSAVDGGAMVITNSPTYVSNSTFSGNGAMDYSGVVTSENSIHTFNSSTFIGNVAREAAVMQIYNSFVSVTGSTFSENMADIGGVIYADNSTFNASGSNFSNNSASIYSGIMETFLSSITLSDCYLTSNSAGYDSAAIWCQDGNLSMLDIQFSSNIAGSYYGGVILSSNCLIYAANSTFENNLGSVHVYHSLVTFTGTSNFKNCTESADKIQSNATLTHQEGGAITSFKSIIYFIGVANFLNNKARNGGAILATDSTIEIHSETNIINNLATNKNGGALHLRLSTLEIHENCHITNNHAIGQGGGIHAHSSQVTIYNLAVLQFVQNSAQYGGAMSLEVNSKLNMLRINDRDELLIFKDNYATYGGGIYVADETNSDACSSNIDCFFQTLIGIVYKGSNQINIIFKNNSAIEQGSNLFGGLLDRCVRSPYAEIFYSTQNDSLTYLTHISNITEDSVASLPVSVCFCTIKGQPNCSYQPPPIEVRKGYTFSTSVVAVDQVGHPIEANIISSLTSSYGGLGESQHFQPVGTNCTNLRFNVFSPQYLENITLFADGPCGNSAPSTRYLEIQFLNCSCPIGLKPSNRRPTACECICDRHLSPYVGNCSDQFLVLRENNSAWISYINSTDPPGYIIHRYCPLDYCRPSTENISINLNLPRGADAQCAYNRTGVLCGACQRHLSLSLGSSQCLPCHIYWPAIFIVIIAASIVAGILLVATLLILNMTVATGLINSFIFYSNIINVSGIAFFPSSKPTFPTVFVAWLNLDIGIDVCFFKGLDAYTKTWLQLAFPVYIISLVIAVILVSEYSPRFAQLIGKKDPVATLATLILLSYAKLLSIALSTLSYIRLHYPDGTTELVWLPDGNVKYLQGKHIVLLLVAAFIAIVGLAYTVLLFFWQWLVCAPEGKLFAWTRNTKLNIFIAAYHSPHNSKHRYWTGLMLLARVILYISSSLTIHSGPQTSLVTTNILVGCLFLLKGISKIRVYKKFLVDAIETILYFNLLVVTAVNLYNLKAVSQRIVVAYISTVTTLLLLIGVIIYHLISLIDKDTTISQIWQKKQQPPLEKSTKSEVTHSVIELPEPCHHPQETAASGFELEIIQEMDGSQIITPPYQ